MGTPRGFTGMISDSGRVSRDDIRLLEKTGERRLPPTTSEREDRYRDGPSGGYSPALVRLMSTPHSAYSDGHRIA